MVLNLNFCAAVRHAGVVPPLFAIELSHLLLSKYTISVIILTLKRVAIYIYVAMRLEGVYDSAGNQ